MNAQLMSIEHQTTLNSCSAFPTRIVPSQLLSPMSYSVPAALTPAAFTASMVSASLTVDKVPKPHPLLEGIKILTCWWLAGRGRPVSHLMRRHWLKWADERLRTGLPNGTGSNKCTYGANSLLAAMQSSECHHLPSLFCIALI